MINSLFVVHVLQFSPPQYPTHPSRADSCVKV